MALKIGDSQHQAASSPNGFPYLRVAADLTVCQSDDLAIPSSTRNPVARPNHHAISFERAAACGLSVRAADQG